jgi:hypothetical protein
VYISLFQVDESESTRLACHLASPSASCQNAVSAEHVEVSPSGGVIDAEQAAGGATVEEEFAIANNSL